MIRIVGVLTGALCVIAGIPLTLSPIPLGLLLIGAGVLILTASSPPFARWLERRREKHHRIDRVLDKAEDALPDRLAEPLVETNPKHAGCEIRRLDPAGAAYRRRNL